MRARAFLLAAMLGAAPSASAEIAVLTNGETLKLTSHRTEGSVVFLSLKGGGEVGVLRSDLSGIVPDEVLDEVIPQVIAAVEKGGDVRALATAAALRHGLDPALVLAIVAAESGFRPEAVSPKGAQGLMQLMPATARDMGVTDIKDPAQNVDGGSRYLKWLLERYDGDLTRAIAAYNAGPGAVERHKGVPPYRETRQYVERVMKNYKTHASKQVSGPEQAPQP